MKQNAGYCLFISVTYNKEVQTSYTNGQHQNHFFAAPINPDSVSHTSQPGRSMHKT